MKEVEEEEEKKRKQLRLCHLESVGEEGEEEDLQRLFVGRVVMMMMEVVVVAVVPYRKRVNVVVTDDDDDDYDDDDDDAGGEKFHVAVVAAKIHLNDGDFVAVKEEGAGAGGC